MRQFYDACSPDDTYSAAQLDSIAREYGGVVTSIGYGYARSGAPPRPQHGYSFRWINTGGMGNHGSLVLIGETRHARAQLREGRLAIWQHDLDVSYETVQALDRASRGVPRGREIAVLRAAIVIAKLPPRVLRKYPGVGNGATRYWERVLPDEAFSDLSCPRLDAAFQVAWNALGQ